MSEIMISYAQNHEDVVLARCFRGQPFGFYIDVGAWDPESDSVTKYFYDKGWCGINIEPNFDYYRKLVAARPRDVNLQLVVSNAKADSIKFAEVEGTGLSAISTVMDVDTLFSAGYVPQYKEVALKRLSDIVDKHARRAVDFLKIDVEGAEKSVIESAEWRGFRPRVIVVEAVRPLTHEYNWFEWEGILLAHNYKFGLFDGLNRFYYRSEEPELREKLSVPSNVLDNFVPARLLALENQVKLATKG